MDLEHLRRTLVDGWPPTMTVSIQSGEMAELLDEVARLRALEQESQLLAALALRALALVDVVLEREAHEG